jgi:small nuclear ribonucleoprotein G
MSSKGAAGATSTGPKAAKPELGRYMDKRIAIQLNGSRRVTGRLRGYDPFMNLVLEEAVEDVTATDKREIGNIVRGNAAWGPWSGWARGGRRGDGGWEAGHGDAARGEWGGGLGILGRGLRPAVLAGRRPCTHALSSPRRSPPFTAPPTRSSPQVIRGNSVVQMEIIDRL